MHSKRFQVYDFQTLLCGIINYEIINVILRFLHCMKYVQLRFLAAKWTVKERSNGNVSKKKN